MAHARLELLENTGLISRRDPDAGIGDRQQQRICITRRLDADRAPWRSKFDGIRDQVEESLLQPPFIAVDDSDLRRTAKIEFQVAALGTFTDSDSTDWSIPQTSMRPVSSTM